MTWLVFFFPTPGSTSFLAYLRTSVGRRAWAVPQKWGCSCESLSRLLRCTATPPSEQTSPGRTLARTEHTAPCRDRVEDKTQHNFHVLKENTRFTTALSSNTGQPFWIYTTTSCCWELRVMWHTGERQHVLPFSISRIYFVHKLKRKVTNCCSTWLTYH